MSGHPLCLLPGGWGLTVEQLLLLVALGVVFPGVPAWGTVKAGRLPDSLWALWLSSAAHG